MILSGIFLISCEKDDPTIIDPILTFPQIDSAYLTPDVFDTSVVNCTATAVVTSEEAIRQVTAEVTNPLGEKQTIVLQHQGNGVYSGLITYNMTCRLVGFYNVKFQAENVSGLFSPELDVGFNVINSGNERPILSDLIAPDTLQRPSGIGADTLRQSFLQLRATDPNGQCDIESVFFNSFKPDGSPSTGNPFRMYNDGTNCDTIPNDSKYSLCIYIHHTAQLGTFTFKFNAKDRPQLLSDTLYHYIYVRP